MVDRDETFQVTLRELVASTVHALNVDGQVKASNKEIATLLPEFKGHGDDAEQFIRRVDAVKTAYNVSDNLIMLTVANKLTAQAKTWFHSKIEFITMSWDDFKVEFNAMFGGRPSKLALMRNFENRKWRKNEKFSVYCTEKVSLGNLANLSENDIIEYVIDGFNNSVLQSQARMQEFTSINDLVRVMNNITNEDKYYGSTATSNVKSHPSKPETTTNASSNTRNIRCFNCNETGHRINDCKKPKRPSGSCFKCGKMGHKVSECQTKKTENQPDSTTNVVEDNNKLSYKNFIVNFSLSIIDEYKCECNFNINAMLDTGSPINLIKSKYIPSCSLETNIDNVSFSGINGSPLKILGIFNSVIRIQNVDIHCKFYVVPDDTMSFPSILGRDFLANCPFKITVGDKIVINNVNKTENSNSDHFLDEIMTIDYDERQNPKEIVRVGEQIDHPVRLEVENVCKQYLEDVENNKSVGHEYFMQIKLKHEQPITFTPRRISYADKQKLQVILDELLKNNIIRPSKSPYASPIVLVHKKNNEIRLCVDFRALNDITIKDNYPTPLIDDHLDRLKDKNYFSSLDLKNGFFHVKMHPDSIKYTSFTTPLGQFEYLRMPFGLTNAPREFNRFTAQVFENLIRENKILLYLDDILIATETINEHINILKEIFEIASKNKLHFRFDKCKFLFKKITYLGYLISSDGIQPDPSNVEAVTKYPLPKNSKEVHRFVGLASYFRRFISNFSIIAKPLYDLIKKNVPFKFGTTEMKAFETLKEKLISQPVLSIYSPDLETELHCDASSIGYGAVLLQKQTCGKFKPTFYFSKRTTPAEGKYHSFELECLAAINAIKRFHIYLSGKKFKIITDCDSFRLTLAKKDVNPRIARWALFLQNYDYTIVHRSAKQMQHVDALSRAQDIFVIEPNSFELTLSYKQNADPEIKRLRERLEQVEDKYFELRNGLVYRKEKKSKKLLFYVPTSMENSVIRTSHDDLGHLSNEKCCEYILRTYWFPQLREKVKTYIDNCLKCIAYSPVSGKAEGYLHSIKKGNLPFNTIHIDHYGPLEKSSRGYKYIFEVIDAFSKFIRFFPCKTVQTSEVITHLNNYFTSYSKPLRIISDRGSCFTSNAFKNFVDEHLIEHVLIATHVPRSNGQIERSNRVLTPVLAKLCETPNKWPNVLNEVEFALNNSEHKALKNSPSKILFGVNQIGPINDTLKIYLDSLQNDNQNLIELREKAAENIIKLQEYNEKYYNKKRKPISNYKVGDYVVIKNIDTTPGCNKKLIPKFRGPYEIKKTLDNDRFVVADVEGFQQSQIPFETVCSPDSMRIWSPTEEISDQSDDSHNNE